MRERSTPSDAFVPGFSMSPSDDGTENHMTDGFVRVATASPALRVADPRFNTDSAIATAKEAAAAGVKVLVFPELNLSAYTIGDLVFQTNLLAACERELARYIEETKALDLLSFVGLPVAVFDRVYNAAAAVSHGELLGIIPKSHLPNYNEFYEMRHFAPAPTENRPVHYAGFDTILGAKQLFTCREMPALSVAAEICEDIWVSVPPSVAHSEAGARIIVNLSASDDFAGKPAYRTSLVAMQSAKETVAYLYTSCGPDESGTDTVFGAHMIIAENGAVVAEAKPFSGKTLLVTEVDASRISSEHRRSTNYIPRPTEDYAIHPFSLKIEETPLTRIAPKLPFVPEDPSHRKERCELILNIQATGLAGRLSRSHSESAVVGVSGGLDSTLALLVAVRAADMLGRKRSSVLAVTMPCFGTTARTKGNAERLAELLGAELRVVDIKEAVAVHFRDIGQKEETYDVVYENAQARERTQVLMDLANGRNGLVVGTGDLSELALGWATYNGDHMSMYAVNSSVPKTLVRHLVTYIADTERAAGHTEVADVLVDILNTPVSPELLPPKDGEIAQCTEGIVGPYELHDYFLYYTVRFGFSPKKVYRMAKATFGDTYHYVTILGWLKVFYRRFLTQQFKRSCMPDGPKVGSVALSPRGDFRMPSDASPALWLSEIEEIEKNSLQK